jgi:hypothetical protein
MTEIIVWFIIIGLLAFWVETIVKLLFLFGGWFYRVFIFPQTDAKQSFEQFQEWQRGELEGTPYEVTPRDPTRPNDGEEANPLMELWRRGHNT